MLKTALRAILLFVAALATSRLCSSNNSGQSDFLCPLPLPEQKNSASMESRVIGALAYGTGYGALSWTEPALEVVEVNTPRFAARLILAISEHIDLEGLDHLLADDPDDALNIIISKIHKILFNADSSATETNKLQDIQAVLLTNIRLV